MAATVAWSWRGGDWVPHGISTAMCWSCAPVLALMCVIWYVQHKEIYFWPSSCSQRSFLHYCFSSTLQHSIPTGLAAGITASLPFPPLCLLQLCERSAELGKEGTLKALCLHCSQTQNDHFWTSAASSALCCILVFKAMAMHFVFFYQNLDSARKKEPTVRWFPHRVLPRPPFTAHKTAARTNLNRLEDCCVVIWRTAWRGCACFVYKSFEREVREAKESRNFILKAPVHSDDGIIPSTKVRGLMVDGHVSNPLKAQEINMWEVCWKHSPERWQTRRNIMSSLLTKFMVETLITKGTGEGT